MDSFSLGADCETYGLGADLVPEVETAHGAAFGADMKRRATGARVPLRFRGGEQQEPALPTLLHAHRAMRQQHNPVEAIKEKAHAENERKRAVAQSWQRKQDEILALKRFSLEKGLERSVEKKHSLLAERSAKAAEHFEHVLLTTAHRQVHDQLATLDKGVRLQRDMLRKNSAREMTLYNRRTAACFYHRIVLGKVREHSQAVLDHLEGLRRQLQRRPVDGLTQEHQQKAHMHNELVARKVDEHARAVWAHTEELRARLEEVPYEMLKVENMAKAATHNEFVYRKVESHAHAMARHLEELRQQLRSGGTAAPSAFEHKVLAARHNEYVAKKVHDHARATLRYSDSLRQRLDRAAEAPKSPQRTEASTQWLHSVGKKVQEFAGSLQQHADKFVEQLEHYARRERQLAERKARATAHNTLAANRAQERAEGLLERAEELREHLRRGCNEAPAVTEARLLANRHNELVGQRREAHALALQARIDELRARLKQPVTSSLAAQARAKAHDHNEKVACRMQAHADAKNPHVRPARHALSRMAFEAQSRARRHNELVTRRCQAHAAAEARRTALWARLLRGARRQRAGA